MYFLQIKYVFHNNILHHGIKYRFRVFYLNLNRFDVKICKNKFFTHLKSANEAKWQKFKKKAKTTTNK